MTLLKEFRDFALKGNVIDLAVGVVIGAAFGKIVTSLIDDLIMPLVSMVGGVDYSNWYLGLSAAVREASARGDLNLADARKVGPVMAYGSFISITINFLIQAFCIFMVIKAFNIARRRFEKEQPAPAPAGPTPDQKLLTEIRDILKAK